MTNRDTDLPTEAEKDDFRRTMGRLASGVCVVTARWGNMDHAMTATAVASVSLEPRLVMFAVHIDSRMRDALEATNKWALNIMGQSGQADAQWLATPGRPIIGQLDRVPFFRGESTSAAILERAISALECETKHVYSAGDHDLVVGRVLSTHLGPNEPGLVHRNSDFFAVP